MSRITSTASHKKTLAEVRPALCACNLHGSCERLPRTSRLFDGGPTWQTQQHADNGGFACGIRACCPTRRGEQLRVTTALLRGGEFSPEGEQAVEGLLEEPVAANGDNAVKACQLLRRQRLQHLPRVVQPLRADHRALHACRLDGPDG